MSEREEEELFSTGLYLYYLENIKNSKSIEKVFESYELLSEFEKQNLDKRSQETEVEKLEIPKNLKNLRCKCYKEYNMSCVDEICLHCNRKLQFDLNEFLDFKRWFMEHSRNESTSNHYTTAVYSTKAYFYQKTIIGACVSFESRNEEQKREIEKEYKIFQIKFEIANIERRYIEEVHFLMDILETYENQVSMFYLTLIQKKLFFQSQNDFKFKEKPEISPKIKKTRKKIQNMVTVKNMTGDPTKKQTGFNFDFPFLVDNSTVENYTNTLLNDLKSTTLELFTLGTSFDRFNEKIEIPKVENILNENHYCRFEYSYGKLDTIPQIELSNDVKITFPIDRNLIDTLSKINLKFTKENIDIPNIMNIKKNKEHLINMLEQLLPLEDLTFDFLFQEMKIFSKENKSEILKLEQKNHLGYLMIFLPCDLESLFELHYSNFKTDFDFSQKGDFIQSHWIAFHKHCELKRKSIESNGIALVYDILVKYKNNFSGLPLELKDNYYLWETQKPQESFIKYIETYMRLKRQNKLHIFLMNEESDGINFNSDDFWIISNIKKSEIFSTEFNNAFIHHNLNFHANEQVLYVDENHPSHSFVKI
eukprot:gene4954-8548_t